MFLLGSHGVDDWRKKSHGASGPQAQRRCTSSRTKCTTTGSINGANQIGGKDKRAIHGDHNIQPAPWHPREIWRPKAFTRFRDSGSGICGHFCHGHETGTSVITTPVRVALPAANSAAMRQSASPCDLSASQVSTGQELFSQRLTTNLVQEARQFVAFLMAEGLHGITRAASCAAQGVHVTCHGPRPPLYISFSPLAGPVNHPEA